MVGTEAVVAQRRRVGHPAHECLAARGQECVSGTAIGGEHASITGTAMSTCIGASPRGTSGADHLLPHVRIDRWPRRLRRDRRRLVPTQAAVSVAAAPALYSQAASTVVLVATAVSVGALLADIGGELITLFNSIQDQKRGRAVGSRIRAILEE